MYTPWHTDALGAYDQVIYDIESGDKLGPDIVGYDYVGVEVDVVPVSEQTPAKGKAFPRVRQVSPDELDVVMQETGAFLRKQTNANTILQTPKKAEQTRVLSKEPSLGNPRYDFCFTDISKGYDKNNRRIFVRQKDGTLRTADQQERDQSDQMYFPKNKNPLKLPGLFMEHALEGAMNNNRQAEILDSICKLRQPDTADYINVHRKVYENVNTNMTYSLLQGTHHFYGLMMWTMHEKNIDNLITTLLLQHRMPDANALATAVHDMHPDMPSAIKANDSKQKSQIAHLREYVFASSVVVNARLLTQQMEKSFWNHQTNNPSMPPQNDQRYW